MFRSRWGRKLPHCLTTLQCVELQEALVLSMRIWIRALRWLPVLRETELWNFVLSCKGTVFHDIICSVGIGERRLKPLWQDQLQRTWPGSTGSLQVEAGCVHTWVGDSEQFSPSWRKTPHRLRFQDFGGTQLSEALWAVMAGFLLVSAWHCHVFCSAASLQQRGDSWVGAAVTCRHVGSSSLYKTKNEHKAATAAHWKLCAK